MEQVTRYLCTSNGGATFRENRVSEGHLRGEDPTW